MGRIRYLLALSLILLSFQAMAADSAALKQAHADHRKGYVHHIQKDYDTALIWYEKSAAVGLAKSEYAIGRILAFDREGERDFDAALPWIIRAAEQRSSSQGQGFAESQKRARESLDWMCKYGAADFPSSMPQNKDGHCLYRRGRRLYYGSKKYNIARDYTSARHYLHKALEKGEMRAAEHLMRIYGNGYGTDKDPALYQKMMRLAAEYGDGDAIMALTSQEKDSLSQEDYIANVHRAANDGHYKANRYLGDMYLYEQDTERAFTHYFLSGRTHYPAKYSIFSKHSPMKTLLENPQAGSFFEAGKANAIRIAQDGSFSKRKHKAISKSYEAISARHAAVQKTGRVRSKEEHFLYLFLAWIAFIGFQRPFRFMLLLLRVFLGRFTNP